jgi:hypothetical protein
MRILEPFVLSCPITLGSIIGVAHLLGYSPHDGIGYWEAVAVAGIVLNVPVLMALVSLDGWVSALQSRSHRRKR